MGEVKAHVSHVVQRIVLNLGRYGAAYDCNEWKYNAGAVFTRITQPQIDK